jgi:hypothetical protein
MTNVGLDAGSKESMEVASPNDQDTSQLIKIIVVVSRYHQIMSCVMICHDDCEFLVARIG